MAGQRALLRQATIIYRRTTTTCPTSSGCSYMFTVCRRRIALPMPRREASTASGRLREKRSCHFCRCGSVAFVICDGDASLCNGISTLGSDSVFGRHPVTGYGHFGLAHFFSTCSGGVQAKTAVQVPVPVCKRPIASSVSTILSAVAYRFVSSTLRSVFPTSGRADCPSFSVSR